MDSKEAEFLAKLLATFKIEAEEHIKNLSDGLLTLENPNSEEHRQETLQFIFREAHSLKGAARAVNFQSIEKICQVVEDILSEWKQNAIQPSLPLFDTLYKTIDYIGQLIHSSESEEAIGDLDQYNQLLKSLQKLKQHSKASKEEEIDIPQVEKAKTAEPPAKEPKDKTIRISSSKLDRLFQQVEEMLIVKLAVHQRTQQFKELLDTTAKWEREWARMQTQINFVQSFSEESFLNHVKREAFSQQLARFLLWQQDFMKELRDHINGMAKSSSQDNRLIGSMVDTLLEDTKSILMQPFSSLFESFPRMVRDLAHSLGKEVQLFINGGEIEIDRRILEEMKDPMIHLIRNAIDHGIETPEERKKTGKPSLGTLTLSASQFSGNTVEISLVDDGKGIDIEKVKQAALKQGSLNQKDLEKMTEREVLMLIFQSGLSTSSIITDLSGRGLGLGIVAEKMEKLGGQIFIETKPGKGAAFRMLLPLTLATFRGVLVQASNQDFIIPTQNIKRVLRLTIRDIKSIENRPAIVWENRTLSFISLGDLLGLPPYSGSQNAFLLILILKAGEKDLAVGVDRILSEQEVLVKTLGKQLQRVKSISAATILEGGRVVPILDPFDLIKSLNKGALASIPIQAPSLEKSSAKQILIAEDSVTARILLKNILESAGYQVKTAVDGAEALSLLKTEKFDLLVSDIEMPRMTGLELTSRVRKTEALKSIPIVLCTSKGSREDREKGIEVGANAYIDKNSFSHSSLLDIIQKLL